MHRNLDVLQGGIIEKRYVMNWTMVPDRFVGPSVADLPQAGGRQSTRRQWDDRLRLASTGSKAPPTSFNWELDRFQCDNGDQRCVNRSVLECGGSLLGMGVISFVRGNDKTRRSRTTTRWEIKETRSSKLNENENQIDLDFMIDGGSCYILVPPICRANLPSLSGRPCHSHPVR
ncbi:hypothetical protein PGTUg99_004658 [Puccinia graminis f. sp. tritici]|uniref:Uncharacterized protein n=1 Tax=Puccinia graminis f. sp. tritici TaxID=56615 RepID=A0A5B0NK77_PUCGR|nr:hypothetical protein PGTUg99_004658 [Puccinia graminis f. sp. tritici]